jgi:hypothetical protein
LVEKVGSLGEKCWNLSRAEGLGRCKKVDLGFVAPNTLCISEKIAQHFSRKPSLFCGFRQPMKGQRKPG